MEEISLATLANVKKQGEKATELAEVNAVTEPVVYSPEERNRIEEIKTEIDFMDTQTTVQYGVGVQRRMTEFADSIMSNVRSKDGGEVGNLLSDLVIAVKSVPVSMMGFLAKCL